MKFSFLIYLFLSLFVKNVQAAPPLPPRSTFYLMPTVENFFACDEGLQNASLKSVEQVNQFCIERKFDGAKGVNRLLDALEPGGPKGQVQVGYVATLQLLSLYQRQGSNWVLDDKKIQVFLQLLTNVKRPVVVYLAADHFDSQGALVDGLLEDPSNLMLLSNGKPAMANYFGYRIAPYTLQTTDAIAVNYYRFTALKQVVKRLTSLPEIVQKRVIAVTLPGELHQMFSDFESGTGRYEDIQVTDYNAASVAGFRQWLINKYGSIQKFNTTHGTAFARPQDIPAPAKDLRKVSNSKLAEHYDAYADGTLPIAGWLWDPLHRVKQLLLYLNGALVGPIAQGFNRQDVYRAVAEVNTPNVGFRRDLDFSQMASGQHVGQVVASTPTGLYLVGQVAFNVKQASGKAQKSTSLPAAGLAGLKPLGELSGVKYSLDLPHPDLELYFNSLARDWNEYRQWQVRQFMDRVYQIALEAGLPASKIYSHQILPSVNSSWNPQLFAVEQTLTADVPWKMGINLYGGATDSGWVRGFLAQNKVTDYGVPEFNPQQWKRPGAHLEALTSHYLGGARFVSPYYLSAVPDRFRVGASNGVNAMELRPDNPKEGSDQFYRAIRQFAEH